jgi:hypothetical protein
MVDFVLYCGLYGIRIDFVNRIKASIVLQVILLATHGSIRGHIPVGG